MIILQDMEEPCLAEKGSKSRVYSSNNMGTRLSSLAPVSVDEEAARLAGQAGGVDWRVQGTLYPDVIESSSVKGPSQTIKSHHNVGGLPEGMKLKLIEPLRNLFNAWTRLSRASPASSTVHFQTPVPRATYWTRFLIPRLHSCTMLTLIIPPAAYLPLSLAQEVFTPPLQRI